MGLFLFNYDHHENPENFTRQDFTGCRDPPMSPYYLQVETKTQEFSKRRACEVVGRSSLHRFAFTGVLDTDDLPWLKGITFGHGYRIHKCDVQLLE